MMSHQPGRRPAARFSLARLFRPVAVGALLASAVATRAAIAETHEVRLQGGAFQPALLTIQVGDSVRFRNMDAGMPHNVSADDGSFRCATGCDSGVNPGTDYEPGQEPESPGDPATGSWQFTRTFPAADDVRYHCQVHGGPGGAGMSGRIVVQSGGGGGGSAGLARFTADRFTVSESGGTATVSVERAGGSAGSVAVTVSTGSGSATASSDFEATSQVVSWVDGAAGTRSIQVAVVDDQVSEGTEVVTLTLSSSTGGLGVGAPATAELRILDDEQQSGGGSAGTVRLEAARLWTFEDAGELAIRVLREGGASGAVSVPVTISGGSASAGVDFGGGSGTLTWGNGDQSAKTLVVAPVDDGPGEGTERVVLQLGPPSGGAALAASSTVTVFLLERPASCVTSEHGLCLGGRFVAQIAFADGEGGTGQANAVSLTADSGYFTFFDAANVESVVKVLAACPINGHFWVFGAGLTDVEVDLTVIDTENGVAVVYSNPAGTAFRPITDIEAFDCP